MLTFIRDMLRDLSEKVKRVKYTSAGSVHRLEVP
jgi:hypothetical protein